MMVNFVINVVEGEMEKNTMLKNAIAKELSN